MGALAIILAREGSKGLPGKNARPIAGQPCVAWTIDAARRAERAGAIDRVVLSTDGVELARIGREMGVEVVDRPAKLASDGATVDAAARHAARQVEGASHDPFVILYANVPIRPPDLIERAIELRDRTGADSVQSYVVAGKYHPWWTSVVDDAGGVVRPWEGDRLNHGVHRRQDLPPAHVPDGGVLVVSRGALMFEIEGVPPGPHAFLGLDHRGIVTQPGEVVDIDNEIDALVAEAMLGGTLSPRA